jgi:hypothetical protein
VKHKLLLNVTINIIRNCLSYEMASCLVNLIPFSLRSDNLYTVLFFYEGSDPARSESEDEDHVVEAAIRQQRLGTTSSQNEGETDKRTNSSDAETESPSIIDNNPIEEVMVLSSESSISKEENSSSESSEADSIVVEAVVKNTLSKVEERLEEIKQFPSSFRKEEKEAGNKSPVAQPPLWRKRRTSTSQVASSSTVSVSLISVPGSSGAMTKTEIGVVPGGPSDVAVGGDHVADDGQSALDDHEKEAIREGKGIQ